MPKITLIKASGDAQKVTVPTDVKTMKDLRKYLEMATSARILETGEELGQRTRVRTGMKLVIIGKHKQS